jgi:hypothetical protein
MTLVEAPFSIDNLYELSEYVVARWRAGAERDWSVPAGTVEWSCTKTADHAVDTVFAPAFFLASRKQDAYPDMGGPFSLGPEATPDQLVQALEVATRVLAAVVADAGPDVRAVLFRRPQIMTAPPGAFVPRGATELILHAHDVCTGLGVPYEPPAELCRRLREHTRPWPMWTVAWHGLPSTDDPWGDLLAGSGRQRQPGTSQ